MSIRYRCIRGVKMYRWWMFSNWADLDGVKGVMDDKFMFLGRSEIRHFSQVRGEKKSKIHPFTGSIARHQSAKSQFVLLAFLSWSRNRTSCTR